MKKFRKISFDLRAKLQACPKCDNQRHFDLMRNSLGGGVYWVHLRCACGFEPPLIDSVLTSPEDGGDEMALAARKGWDRHLAKFQRLMINEAASVQT